MIRSNYLRLVDLMTSLDGNYEDDYYSVNLIITIIIIHY